MPSLLRICTGINHQTWYTDIRFQGRRISAAELADAFARQPKYSQTEKLRIDVLRRFGACSTESNGHLSEYLPWHRKRPDEINRWIDLSNWINGEAGGYLRVCTERRDRFETDVPRWLAEAGAPLAEYVRTDEHCSHIIEALETGRVYRGHFNVKNTGLVTNLLQDCIVETPGFVDRFGLNMVAGQTLPLGCAATCTTSVNVQRMAMQAAVTGDVDLLKLAVLHDPLVGAVCKPDEVWQMVDEMLVAGAEWLPQYADAIAAARERLARGRVATRVWSGAARLAVRQIIEEGLIVNGIGIGIGAGSRERLRRMEAALADVGMPDAALLRKRGLAYLFISHGPKVVRALCQSVLMMQHGRIVEQGPCHQILTAPRDPYTRALMDAAFA
jgi:alpha-galactosidase